MEKFSNNYSFNGIYRGYVVDNIDPLIKGRIKVFIPGVYSVDYRENPEVLPWCVPAMSIFGGGSPNKDKKVLNPEVGWSSVPHFGNYETGSQVFIFFENGDINYPVYFAVAQSGPGWLSEHPNQHVFKSDNVRIRIDEDVTNSNSTCKFDSYNTENTYISKKQLELDCKNNGWKFKDGNIKNLETRIDIEVEATKLNAINLNIHGNVNTHIDGNWFIEHIGNKYEYHKGEHFIRHEGNTHIDQTGHWTKIISGNVKHQHEGDYLYDETGSAKIFRTGTLEETITGDVKNTYYSNLTELVGKNTHQTYKGWVKEKIFKFVDTEILGYQKVFVDDGITIRSEDFLTTTAKNNIHYSSDQGNIVLKTDGKFDLIDNNGSITSDGFNNLGNKGNIQFISTFGNINMQCRKDDSIASFTKQSVVIPWNPGFLAEINDNIQMYPTFNKDIATRSGLEFPTNIFNIGNFISFFASLPDLLIYDGLPVFLPTKMIVQNPNTPAPNNANDLSWIPKFRSEASDWRDIPDDVYWKLPGRMMGNINIETWSGDINIKTESEIGCAGNINITACEKTGTLPGYQIGCVNIVNSGKKRIYPDPRDLFLDSDFNLRNFGQLKLFSHATNSGKTNLLPAAANAIIQSVLGVSITVKGSEYTGFMKSNGLDIASKGKSIENINLKVLNKIRNSKDPTLGCIKCIGDYILGLPGIQELCYATENLKDFSPWGLHKYGFSRFNPFDTKNPRGTFNIETLNFDKISLGDGHAIDMKFVDRELNGPNIGGFNLHSSGDMNLVNDHNFYQITNNFNEENKRIVSHVLTEKAFDFYPPKILVNTVNLINGLWSSTGGKIFEIKDGVMSVLSILGGPSIDTGIKILNVLPKIEYISLGWDNQKLERIGKSITYEDRNLDTYNFDLGLNFEEMKDDLSKGDLSKTTIEFRKDSYILKSYNGSCSITYKTGDEKSIKIKEFTPNISVNIYLNDTFHYYGFEDTKNCLKRIETHDDIFNFTWKLSDPPPATFSLKCGFPNWYYNNDYVKTYDFGQGIFESTKSIERSEWRWHDDSNEIINILEPATSWIDNEYIKNIETKSNDESKFAKYIKAEGRNITNKITNIAGWDYIDDFSVNAIRSSSKNIIYEAPINRNILTIHSDNIWEDEENKIIYSTNLLKTIITGTFTPSKYDEKGWKREISNNTEFDQFGFPLNNINIKNGVGDKDTTNNIYIDNGSNTIIDPNISGNINTFSYNGGVNVDSSTNSIVFENGCSGVCSKNDIIFLNGDVSDESQNSINVSNGLTSNKSINGITINNGSGEDTKNNFTFNNGMLSNESINNYVINNGGGGTTTDTIILNNNDHATEYKMYAKGKGIYSDEADISTYSLKTKNDIIGVSYTLTVPTHTENTDIKIFKNSESFNIDTGTFINNVHGSSKSSSLYVLNAETINVEGIKTITQTSPSVVINKIISTGIHHGDFYGFFEGPHLGISGPGVLYATTPAANPAAPNNPPAPPPGFSPSPVKAVETKPIGSGNIASTIKNILINFLKFELTFFEKYF